MFIRRKMIGNNYRDWKKSKQYPVFYLAWKEGSVSREKYIGTNLTSKSIEKALVKVPKKHRNRKPLELLEQYANKRKEK